MSLPPSYNLLKKFPNPVYLETGIFRSDSIALAMEAGFQKIIGIDIDPSCIDFCINRFDLINIPDPRITLYCGDSAEILWSIIKDINDPITFFLDGHSQMLEGEPEFKNPFPLMRELQAIGRHHINTHTILVDDFLILSHPDITGWYSKDIIERVRMINFSYKIDLISNPVRKNFLTAYV